MNNHQDNFIVVIRAAGERTLGVCEDLIRNEIGDTAECITIECSPFEEAIKKSFKIGIESGKKWLVTVDADVLIRKGCIKNLLEIGDKLSSNIFHFEGYLYDGLLFRYRPGGVKIYRTNLLREAINLIPKSGKEIRPESYTQSRMIDMGYNIKNVDIIAGIHDYEQFPEDIFRKSLVHGKKSKKHVFSLIPVWRYLYRKGDNIYGYAIEGAIQGMSCKEEDITNKNNNTSENYNKNNKNIYINTNEVNNKINEKCHKNYTSNMSSFIYQFTDIIKMCNIVVAVKWLFRRVSFKIKYNN